MGAQSADFDESDSTPVGQPDRDPLREGIVPMGAALGAVVAPDIPPGSDRPQQGEAEREARENGAP